jgi:putative membrane protein
MRKLIAPLVCAATMAAVPGSALAHSTPSRTTVAPSAQDTAWVQASIQANIAEVQAAHLAEANTTFKPAIALAKLVIQVHGKLLNQSEHVATKLDITIPTAPNATQASELTTLATLKGKAFNDAYATDELSGYQQFYALTETEANSATNGQVRAAAKFFLPVVKQNLSLAHAAAAALHVS